MGALAGYAASGPSALVKPAPRAKGAVAELLKEKASLPVKPTKPIKSGPVSADGSFGKSSMGGAAVVDGPGVKTSLASKLAPPRRKSQSPANAPMKGADKNVVKAADKHALKAGDRIAAKIGEKTAVEASGKSSVQAVEKTTGKSMSRSAVKVSDKIAGNMGSKPLVTAAANAPDKSSDKKLPEADAPMDDVPEPATAPAVPPASLAEDAEASPVHAEAAPSAPQSPSLHPRAASPLAPPRSPEAEERVEDQAASSPMENLPSDAPFLAPPSGEGAVAASEGAVDTVAVTAPPSPPGASAGRPESPPLRPAEASAPPAVPRVDAAGSSVGMPAVLSPLGPRPMDAVPAVAPKDASSSPPDCKTSLPDPAPSHAGLSPPKRPSASSSPPKRPSASSSPFKRTSTSSSPPKRPCAASSPSKRPSALSPPSDRPSTCSPKGTTTVAQSSKKNRRSSVSPPGESGVAALSADKMDTTPDEVVGKALPATPVAKVALRPPVSPPKAVLDEEVLEGSAPEGRESPEAPPKLAPSEVQAASADAASSGDKLVSKSRRLPLSPAGRAARTPSPRDGHSEGVPVQSNGRLDEVHSSPGGAHGGAASSKMTASVDAAAGSVAGASSRDRTVPGAKVAVEPDALGPGKSASEEPKLLEKVAASAATPVSPGAAEAPVAASASPPSPKVPKANSPDHEGPKAAVVAAVDQSQTEGSMSKPAGRRSNDAAAISASATTTVEPAAAVTTSRPIGRSAAEAQPDDANAASVARSVEKVLPAPPLPPLPPARKSISSAIRPGRSPTGSKSALPIKTPSLLLGSSLIASSAAPATPIKRATPPPWWATATPLSGRSKGAGVKGAGLGIPPRSAEVKDAADGDAVKLTAPTKGDDGKDSSSGGSSRPRLGSGSRATMAPPAPKAPLPSSSGGEGVNERGQKRFRSGDGETSGKWRDAPAAKKRAGGHSDGGSAPDDESAPKDRPSDAAVAASDSRSSPLSGSQRDAPSGMHKPSSPAVRGSSPRSPRRDGRRDSDRGRDRDRDRGDRDGRFRYRGSDRPSHSSRRDRPRGERVSKGDQDA